MLVATWTSEAWREVCEDNQPLILSAFVKTGFLVAKDGSENVKIQVWPKRKGERTSVGPDGVAYDF